MRLDIHVRISLFLHGMWIVSTEEFSSIHLGNRYSSLIIMHATTGYMHE